MRIIQIPIEDVREEARAIIEEGLRKGPPRRTVEWECKDGFELGRWRDGLHDGFGWDSPVDGFAVDASIDVDFSGVFALHVAMGILVPQWAPETALDRSTAGIYPWQSLKHDVRPEEVRAVMAAQSWAPEQVALLDGYSPAELANIGRESWKASPYWLNPAVIPEAEQPARVHRRI
jgi:hypothetical protein